MDIVLTCDEAALARSIVAPGGMSMLVCGIDNGSDVEGVSMPSDGVDMTSRTTGEAAMSTFELLPRALLVRCTHLPLLSKASSVTLLAAAFPVVEAYIRQCKHQNRYCMANVVQQRECSRLKMVHVAQSRARVEITPTRVVRDVLTSPLADRHYVEAAGRPVVG